MHLPITSSRAYCSAKNFVTQMPQKIIKKAQAIKTVKKAVPTAVILLQSFGALSASAPGKASTDLIAYNRLVNYSIAMKMAEKSIEKAKTITFTDAAEKFKPKNKLTKDSFRVNTEYKGTKEELNHFIAQLLEKTKVDKEKNPFYGKADSFIKMGLKYNVNPTVMIAIGMLESGRGTSHAALKKNNIGGLDYKGQRIHFKTVEESIEAMAKTLKNRINENYLTVEEIGNSGKYCSKEVSDHWIKSVRFFLKKM